MKIATWNVNSLNVRLPHVLKWLDTHSPNVLALQELKMNQDCFPESVFLEKGYQAAWYGQKTYNGVAFLSKYPLQNIDYGMKYFEDPQRRLLAATINGIRCISVYCVNGEALESEKFQYKITWFEALIKTIRAELTQYPQLVIMGDFNIAPHDQDTYDPTFWKNRIICSDQEREIFQHLLQCGLYDSFRYRYPDKKDYTWWDYRAHMFVRNLGLRIDHILVSQALLGSIKDCAIDPTPRGWVRPSDHTPVMLTLS